MTPARQRGTALGLCVLGAAVMLLAGGQVWFRGHSTIDGLPTLPVRVTGRDVAAVVSAVGLLALAGAGVALLVGGWVRRGVGGLVCLGGVVAAVRVLDVTALNRDGAVHRALVDAVLTTSTFPSGSSTDAVATAWPWVALIGAVLVAVGGGWVLVTGGRWPRRTQRYDAAAPAPSGKTSAEPADEADAMWKALDRGEDPTESAPDSAP